MSVFKEQKHFYNKSEFIFTISENMLSMLGTYQMDHGTTRQQTNWTAVDLDCRTNGPQEKWTGQLFEYMINGPQLDLTGFSLDKVRSILPALELLPLDCARGKQNISRTFILLFGVVLPKVDGW